MELQSHKYKALVEEISYAAQGQFLITDFWVNLHAVKSSNDIENKEWLKEFKQYSGFKVKDIFEMMSDVQYVWKNSNDIVFIILLDKSSFEGKNGDFAISDWTYEQCSSDPDLSLVWERPKE